MRGGIQGGSLPYSEGKENGLHEAEAMEKTVPKQAVGLIGIPDIYW